MEGTQINLKETTPLVYHFSTRSTALNDFGMTKYNYGNIEVYRLLTTAKSTNRSSAKSFTLSRLKGKSPIYSSRTRSNGIKIFFIRHKKTQPLRSLVADRGTVTEIAVEVLRPSHAGSCRWWWRRDVVVVADVVGTHGLPPR